MAYNIEGIRTYVRDRFSSLLYSSFTQRRPLFALLAGESMAKKEDFGRAGRHIIAGGASMGLGERLAQAGDRTHQFRYQKGQTDAAAVATDSATSVATGFAEDNVGTAQVVWAKKWAPFKVRNDSLLSAASPGGSGVNANLRIASVLDEAIGQGLQREIEAYQTALWNGTLTSVQQDVTALTWPDFIGVNHWVSDGTKVGETTFTHVGGVDRTVETEMQANVQLAADLVTNGHLSNTVPTLRLIRKLKTIPSLGELQAKRSDAGNLCITTGELFEVLANESDSKHTFFDRAIPEMRLVGFENPVIKYDNTLVTWDPGCPAGNMYLLTSGSWLFETQKGENFEIGQLNNKSDVDEGGGDYQFAHVKGKARLTCREPWLQTKVTGLTSS